MTDEQRAIINQRLLDAAESGDVDGVIAALRDGADVEAVDKWRYTSLLYAVSSKHVEMVEILLKAGASVDVRNCFGGTPLHGAVRITDEGKNVRIAQLLLDNNADVNAIERLQKKTPLLEAVLKGYVEMVKLLLQKGADVEAMDHQGDTPLYCVVNYLSAFSISEDSGAEIVQLLLDNGADVNGHQNRYLATASQLAVSEELMLK